MAFTAGFSVNVGDPTKASDVDVLAANDDYLKNAIDTFIANDANNRVLTGTGSGTANAETNLTFDGSTLTVTGTVSATTFSGNVTGGTISGSTGTFSGAVNANNLVLDASGNYPILLENQAGTTADAAISTFDDANGTLLALGSNFYFSSGGAETRFNTSEEAAGIVLNRTGTISLRTSDGSNNTVERVSVGNTGDVAINTSQLFVDQSTSRVGINTTSPTQKLTLSGGSSDVAMLFNSTDTSYHNIGIKKDGSQLRFIEYGNDGTTESANILVLEANGDRVGINTASPTQALDVAGQITINNGSGYLWSTGAVQIYSNGSYLRMRTGSTDRLEIDSSGSMTLQTNQAADTALEIYNTNSSASAKASLKIGYDSGNHLHIYRQGNLAGIFYNATQSGSSHQFQIAGSAKATLDSTGLGLGTDSPTAPLHIIGGDGDPSAAHSGDAQQILENNGTTFFEFATGTTHYSGITFSDDVATRGAIAYDHGTALGGGADSLHFQTAGSLKAVINASGNFGLGSQSPQYKLVVSNGGAAGYEFNVNGLNSGVNTVVYNRSTSAYVDSAHFALNYYIFTGSTPAEVLRATSAGEVWIKNTSDQGAYNLQVGGTGVWGAGAYVNGSDKRLKKSISTYTDNALDLVNQMRPVTFEYIEDYSDDRATQIGFIAQDLQEVLRGKEYLDGIVKDDAEHLNVAYQSLIPVLTKAIQELTARIEALEAA